MNHYVYQITNQLNGKIYVGKRSCKCSIEDDAYMGSGIHIRRAIKKHGIENFSKTIIDVCDDTEMAFELEALIVDVDFLKRSDTYNLCGGGIGGGVGECAPMFGRNHSEETRLKMSANNVGMKGKNHTEDARAKMSANHVGKTHAPEARAKMSAAKTGDRNHMFGKTISPETRAKISANHAMKGKTHSPESIAKMSANNARAMKGKTQSPETRAKISATKRANALSKLILEELK